MAESNRAIRTAARANFIAKPPPILAKRSVLQ
jgi:hypothetical protein